MTINSLFRTFYRAIGFLGLVFLLSSCTSNTFFNAPPAERGTAEQIIVVKSPNDARDYLYFELANGLRAMVISDPSADKAAASLDINIGSGDDSDERPGLAHFLEHMLFLGTDKYPVADDYQAFIADHGGRHNAYTSLEHTNYFFDIDPDFLEPALDRFSRFFVAPLFNSAYVDREKHAVHSEYQARLRNDPRRQFDVYKTVTHPDHPFSNFTVGSLETLAERPEAPLRKALLDFYAEKYSANIMRLVVIGPGSTTQLKSLVESKFSAVPNKDVELQTPAVPLIEPEKLPLWVSIEPVKDIRSLSLQFPIADIREHYLSKPVSYLGNLIGHEGEGSLLSLLKDKGWADGLSAGLGAAGRGFATFSISISLTEEGNQHLDEIIELSFNKIDLIKRQGISQWRYDELKQLNDMAFRFQENGNAMRYAMRLSSALHDYPPELVLRAPYAMDDYDAPLIRSYLDALTPNNLLVTHVAKGVETNQTTRWYSAPYKTQGLPAQLLTRLQSQQHVAGMALPTANPFIPESLDLLRSNPAESAPRQLLKEPGIVLWHKTDTSFSTPRGSFYFSIRSPVANVSPEHAALTNLMVRNINDQLNAFSYPALLAGLNYQLYKHIRGVAVRINGYQDKQDKLLAQILEYLKNGTVDDKKFALHKAELLRSLRNSQQNTPYNQTMDKVSHLVINPRWDDAALLRATEPLNASDLRAFHEQFFAEIEIVAMANGNYSENDAQAMAQTLTSSLLEDAASVAVPRAQVAKIGEQNTLLYQFDVDHPDSAIVSYYQGDNNDVATKAVFALANQIVSTPFYYQLRTQKQLGYIVFSSPMTIMDTPALSFVVQSPNTDVAALDEHIQTFIDDFAANIQAMDGEEFETNRQAVLTKILEKDKRLTDRSNRYWFEIDRENHSFDSREQLAAALRNIDQSEFNVLFKDYLLKDRKRLLTVVAKGTKNPVTSEHLSGYEVIHDIRELQKQGQYF